MWRLKRAMFLLLGTLLVGCAAPERPPVAPVDAGYVVGYRSLEALAASLPKGAIAAVIPEIQAAKVYSTRARLESLVDSGVLRYVQEEARRRVPWPDPLVGQTLALQWHRSAIHADLLEGLGEGAGVTVAVVDTGVDATHPDLDGAFVAGIDAASGEALQPDEDSSNGAVHGTHVSGILAAHGRVRGMAPRARLFPIRAFNPDYAGDFNVAQAIIAASLRGASVFNLSFGGTEYSPVLYDAIAFVLRRGGWVFAAAGNAGRPLPFYPAAYPGVIAVGAAGPDLKPTEFTNTGEWVATYAPGVLIYSTVPGASYGFLSGTSMATPIVAGIAAVLRSAGSQLDAWGMRWLLRNYGVDVQQLLPAVDAAPYGGCLQVKITRSGVPLEGWLTLTSMETGDVFRLATDAQGLGKFFGIPQGRARLEMTWAADGEAGHFSAPVRIFRSCSWVERIDF